MSRTLLLVLGAARCVGPYRAVVGQHRGGTAVATDRQAYRMRLFLFDRHVGRLNYRKNGVALFEIHPLY